jgi:hypothetical protein
MANYYDRVLESFDEGIFDESYDEGIFDEAFFNKRRPTPRIPHSVGTAANFGKHVNPSSSNQQSGYATKAELKSSLNSISEQVNDLKKSNISIASSVKELNEGYEKVIKSIAKKDKSQDSVTNNSVMMSLLGTIANKPSLNADALQIVSTDGGSTTPPQLKVVVDNTRDAIQVDLTKTLLFTLMPVMMSGSGGSSGNNSMMMMLPIVLLLGNNNRTGSSNASFGGGGTDSTLVLAMMMMMMMNKN